MAKSDWLQSIEDAGLDPVKLERLVAEPQGGHEIEVAEIEKFLIKYGAEIEEITTRFD